MKQRVFILGLDGADDGSVGAAVRLGWMPNLERAVGGKLHPLRSTPLPITPAAWTAAFTGYNPGKTGVLTFQRRVANSYRGRLVNSGDLGGAAFHTRIPAAGKTMISVGAPMTSPPPAIPHGVIIPGWDASPGRPMASDPSYIEVIERNSYRIEDEFSHDLAVHSNAMDARFNLMNELLSSADWDCAMLYLGFIDGLGHRFGSGNDMTNALLKRCDERLGALLPAIGDAAFIVCSDHGFGRFSRSFSITQWLEAHGYLSLRSRTFRSSNEGGVPGLEVMDLEDGVIDWENSRAFCWEGVGRHAAIALNIKGEYPRGCVSPRDAYMLTGEIIEKLKAEKDPENGEPIVADVRRREELFWGASTSEFPEIFVDLANDTTAYVAKRKRVDGGFVLDDGIVHRGTFNSHLDDGIWGSSFHVAGGGLRVEDLAPTVYALLDLPIPNDCDGENRSTRSSVLAAVASTTTENAYSSEEEEIVRKRLEDLGYL